jgi:hypothetical protein
MEAAAAAAALASAVAAAAKVEMTSTSAYTLPEAWLENIQDKKMVFGLSCTARS